MEMPGTHTPCRPSSILPFFLYPRRRTSSYCSWFLGGSGVIKSFLNFTPSCQWMSEKHMKAFVLGDNGKVTLQTVPIPSLGPYDVLVKIEKASVCGTDLLIVEQSKDPKQWKKNMEET